MERGRSGCAVEAAQPEWLLGQRRGLRCCGRVTKSLERVRCGGGGVGDRVAV